MLTRRRAGAAVPIHTSDNTSGAPACSQCRFETNLPGVFAVGDVRAGSVKRIAAAVGEGSVCIQLVHKVLAE
jgi:thioredoxin reductase